MGPGLLEGMPADLSGFTMIRWSVDVPGHMCLCSRDICEINISPPRTQYLAPAKKCRSGISTSGHI